MTYEELEKKLGTATKLLARVQKVYTPHPKLREDINVFLANQPAAPQYDPITAEVPLGDMNGSHGRLRGCPCGDGERPGHPLNWCGQVRQPAAPTRKADMSTWHEMARDAAMAKLPDFRAALKQTRGEEPAAPARTEAGEFEQGYAAGWLQHERTEAERHVLDAFGAIPDDDIQLALDLRDGMSGAERRAWKAELARRDAEK